MIIYLTDEEKKAFKRQRFTEREIWQIEKGLNDVVIRDEKKNRSGVSHATVLKNIGRKAYVACVERAAFHWSSSFENEQFAYSFDLSNWFR